MEEGYSTEDAATGDMGFKLCQLVLIGKEANIPSCIPVNVYSGENLRNKPSLLKRVKAPKAESRS